MISIAPTTVFLKELLGSSLRPNLAKQPDTGIALYPDIFISSMDFNGDFPPCYFTGCIHGISNVGLLRMSRSGIQNRLPLATDLEIQS